jgi:hypothetical protein
VHGPLIRGLFLRLSYSRSRIFAFISHVFHYIAVFNFSNRISVDVLVSTDFSTVSSCRCPTQQLSGSNFHTNFQLLCSYSGLET